MLTIHYYSLFDGFDDLWHHAKSLYTETSVFSFSGKHNTGSTEIFSALSDIRNTLTGDLPSEKLVHVVEKLHCKPCGSGGVIIRAVGSFIVGNQFLICGDGVQAEGLPSFKDLGFDVASRRVGRFQEQFVVESGDLIGKYFLAKQELYITNLD
jgi:hypothetical protein